MPFDILQKFKCGFATHMINQLSHLLIIQLLDT